MRTASLEYTLKTRSWILILTAATVCGLLTFDTAALGQEVRNAIRDYRDDRVFNYQPSDPQHRGKLFNTHTKHYGKFYNCDGQENKRNSPYICWKPHYENDFTPRVGFCENLRRDITEIKQRISDGAGNCPSSCSCRECRLGQRQPTYHPQQHAYPSNCPCAQCAVSGGSPTISTAGSSTTVSTAHSQTIQPSCNCPSCRLSSSSSQAAFRRQSGINHGPEHLAQSVSIPASNQNLTVAPSDRKKRYGLVSGRIFDPVSAAQASTATRKNLDQVNLAPRLPFESEEVQVAPPSPQATLAARIKASAVEPPTVTGSKSSTLEKPANLISPRVVEKTEFWKQFKLF